MPIRVAPRRSQRTPLEVRWRGTTRRSWIHHPRYEEFPRSNPVRTRYPRIDTGPRWSRPMARLPILQPLGLSAHGPRPLPEPRARHLMLERRQVRGFRKWHSTTRYLSVGPAAPPVPQEPPRSRAADELPRRSRPAGRALCPLRLPADLGQSRVYP